MKYLTNEEMKQVCAIIDALSTLPGPLSLGAAPLYDCNGDVLGYVGTTEDGEIGFIVEKDDDGEPAPKVHSSSEFKKTSDQMFRLSEYEIANLRHLLCAVMDYNNPYRDLPVRKFNTGDWVGQIKNMLQNADVQVPPNPVNENPNV